MTEIEYTCTSCDTTQPVDLVSENQWEGDEYPPGSVDSICGERYNGCGTVETMVRGDGDE